MLTPQRVPILGRSAPEEVEATERRSAVASQWRLVWWRFRRHRLAVIGLVVVALLYLCAGFCEFLAPSTPDAYHSGYPMAPPQQLHFFGPHGMWLYVDGYHVTVNAQQLTHDYAPDPSHPIALGFFVRGAPYRMWGLIPGDIHLFGPVQPGRPFYPLGSDQDGRDMLSLTMYAARVSMSIGLVGVALSLLLGIFLGGMSGYLGGWVDHAIQRVIEFIRSIPSIPLWMGLAAAVPPGWGQLKMYFAITVILAVIGWTDLARVIRGRFLQVRNEDFVLAAELDGSGRMRVTFRHILPSFTSHIIASLTLAIPAMILGETSLSFLGLGLQPPTVSWGVLLQAAQNVNAVADAPWLLVPGGAVVISILALNFVGDGLRDSADPYAS